MRKIILFISMLFIFVRANAQESNHNSMRIWNDLSDPGMRNLTDLIEMNTDWFMATNDDLAIQFTRNGMAGPGGPWWPVYLNGTRLDLDVWDTKSLQLIPIVLSQIDSVHIVDQPGVHHGVFTDKGGIFIYTTLPDDGFQAEGGLTIGNRAGDPGPFVYTDRATQNVDRIEPITFASVSYGREQYAIGAAFKRHRHSVINPLQLGRISPLQFENEQTYKGPIITGNSLYVHGRYSTGKFNSRFQVGVSDYLDFLFTRIYGNEIPVDRRWGFASLNGSAMLGKGYTLKYRLKRSENDVEELPNKQKHWLRWKQKVSNVGGSVVKTLERGFTETGISYGYYELDNDPGVSDRSSMSLLRAYNHLQVKLSDRLLFHSDLSAVKGERDYIALKSHAGLRKKLNPDNQVSLDLSYSERFPEEDNSLWYWMIEKGFGGDTLAAYRPEELTNRIRYYKAEVGWSALLWNRLKLNAGLSVSKNEDEYYFRHLFAKDGRGITISEFEFINDLDATLLTIPVKIRVHPISSLRQTVSYTWRSAVHGDTEFWDMVPKHRLKMVMNWEPVDNFSIWTKISYQSGSRWSSADSLDKKEVAINPLESITYFADTGNRWQWDAGVKKEIWKDRISLRIDLLNILNKEYRNYPLGPAHSFTLFLGARMTLPG